MSSPKELTRVEILRTARKFKWLKKMPKWTVIVEKQELPARPLVLEAAGVPPNDPTNSHQAVAILKTLGFETRYADESRKGTVMKDLEASSESPTNLKAMMEKIERIASRVPEETWEKVPTDLSKNVDHYLYGAKKTG
jgi:hypothetical protein